MALSLAISSQHVSELVSWLVSDTHLLSDPFSDPASALLVCTSSPTTGFPYRFVAGKKMPTPFQGCSRTDSPIYRCKVEFDLEADGGSRAMGAEAYSSDGQSRLSVW